MKILFCSPGITYQAHALRYTILRAGCMADAGLEVQVVGYPSIKSMDEIAAKLSYIGVYDSFSLKTKGKIDWCGSRFGNFWRFTVDPFLVHWFSLRRARQQCFDLVFVNDMEPWALLLALLLKRQAFQRLRQISLLEIHSFLLSDLPTHLHNQQK